MLTNACDVVALYRPDPLLFPAVAVVAAAFAAFAVYRLPRSPARPVGPSDGWAAAELDLGERHERLEAAVVALEDAFRRNTWLRQRREAMQHLNDMLAGFESLLADGPADETNPRRSAS